MAASVITDAQAEIIRSLSPEEIPAKLRCAVCSKLAVDAFRLPCCGQAICDKCQAKLPSACPLCEHSPLSATDCTPHKNLRTTIRIFLRTAEKKRESERNKGSTPSPPDEPTPVPAAIPAGAPPASEPAQSEQIQPQIVDTAHEEGRVESQHDTDRSANSAVPESDLANGDSASNAKNQPTEDSGEPTEDAVNIEIVKLEANGEEATEGAAEPGVDGTVDNAQNQAESSMNGGFGFGNMNMGFLNMNNFGGGLEQMQMMMAMQNGMPPNAFANFPMMGMPNLNMDPMTMQMYMNGGAGMDMSGMNSMGMGMGGYGSDANNNWNGQQSWNVGQDNYNHPSASGMGNGDYGSFNSGFQTGYNQGDYGASNYQYNDYRRGQHGFRGRGRGRGSYNSNYGRGGWQGRGGQFNQNGYNNFQDAGYTGQQQSFASDLNGHDGGQGAASNPANGQSFKDSNVDEFGRELRPAVADGDEERSGGHAAEDEKPGDPTQGESEETSGLSEPGAVRGNPGMKSYGVPSVGHVEGSDGAQMNSSHMSGIVAQSAAPSAPEVPINAPKGPKAMLRGLPNTSSLYLQANGLLDDNTRSTAPGEEGRRVGSQPAKRRQSKSSSTRRDSHQDGEYPCEKNEALEGAEDREHDSRDKEKRGRDHEHDRDRNHGSPSRGSRSSSRSQHRKESRRHKHQRSDDDHDDHDEHGRRRHGGKHSTFRVDEDAKSRSREEEYDERSRSATPDKSRRSSHRASRKERDSNKRRDRERDRDPDDNYEHRRKSGHRSRRRGYEREKDKGRDREQGRVRDKARDYDKERADRDRSREKEHRNRKERRRDKDRQRERERDKDRHRSERPLKHGHDEAEAAEVAVAFHPPTQPRTVGSSVADTRGLEIKGASSKSRDALADSSRRMSQASEDPHAEERARRDRERLLRETRRMASMAGSLTGSLTGAKRSRQDDEESWRRRKLRRGEVVLTGGDEEERLQRLEREREQGRWD